MNWLKHAQESNLGVCTSHAAVAGCCFLLVLGCLCNRDGHWGVALVVYDAYGDMSSSRQHHICHPFFIKKNILLFIIINFIISLYYYFIITHYYCHYIISTVR